MDSVLPNILIVAISPQVVSLVATLKKVSYTELRNVKKIMEENPHYNIEIAGHTDKIGTRDFNLKLSQKRAQAVINYLKKQGINEGRMTAKGYGESKPLASNDDEKEGRKGCGMASEATVPRDYP